MSFQYKLTNKFIICMSRINHMICDVSFNIFLAKLHILRSTYVYSFLKVIKLYINRTVISKLKNSFVRQFARKIRKLENI